MTLTETCNKCGASLTLTGPVVEDVLPELTVWHETHRCYRKAAS